MSSTFIRHLFPEEYCELKLVSTHKTKKCERKTSIATKWWTYCDYSPEHENMEILWLLSIERKYENIVITKTWKYCDYPLQNENMKNAVITRWRMKIWIYCDYTPQNENMKILWLHIKARKYENIVITHHRKNMKILWLLTRVRKYDPL